MRTRPIAAAALAMSLVTATQALAEGDLTIRPTELPALVLGSEQSDYSMSQNRYELETGKAYKLEVVSTGRKEYAIRAPEFFAAIFLRKVEAGDMEIKAVSLTELEFEQEGEAELYFVPVKPGEYRFYSAGLEEKGMVGTFSVR